MNSLSWLIYAAAVLGDLQAFMCIGFFACVGWFVGLQIGAAMALDWPSKSPEIAESRRVLSFKSIKPAVALAVLIAVVPGQNTVYAIAASEMGERALNSQTGSKAVKALDAWLDRQIAGEPEKKTND